MKFLLYCEIDVEDMKVSSNDKIRVASIFHSISTIASKISPRIDARAGYDSFLCFRLIQRDLAFLKATGIERINTTNFTIYAKQTMTGLKLILLTSPTFPTGYAQDLLGVLYSSYADFVLKDPFYAVDMPIRCSLFDKAVHQILAMR